MTAPQRGGWIPALAGYRALAALAVFAFHIVSIDAPSGALGRWTAPLGNTAVSLFFVLSGYLIYRPFAAWALFDAKPVSSWRFIVRRLGRILPVYWVALTIHLFILDASEASTLGEYLTSYALIQNFRGVMVFLPPFVAWSLSIELWFSIALPAIAALLRRAGTSRSFDDRVRIQLTGIGGLAIAAIVFRVWAVGAPQDGVLLWMPAYLDWFAAGLVLAVLVTTWRVRQPPALAHQLAAHPWTLASVAFAAYWAVTELGLPGGFVTPTSFQIHSQFLLEALFSALLVTIAVLPNPSLGAAGRFLASRTLQWLGAASYAIYLFHPVVTDRILAERPEISQWTIALIAVPITLVVSGIVHRVVEQPASRFVDRLVAPRRPEVPAPAQPSPTAKTVELPEVPAPKPPNPERRRSRSRPVRSEDWAPALGALRSGRVHVLLLVLFAFASPLLSDPGRYVADSRFELTADPEARLRRMFVLWDGARDLGRPAEEFWPGVTALYTGFHQLGFSPWVQQRLVHATLLAVAALGAYALSRTLRPDHPWRALATAMIYGFGPFSAVYLLPVSIYLSYALAPWFVVAVLRGGRRHRPFAWAAATALMLFAAGNADPPGLVMALTPAAMTAIAIFVRRREQRRPLTVFAASSFVLTMATSAAMIVKTTTGAAALSHRLVETEAPATIAATSSFTESIRGMGFWLSYFRLGPTPFRTHLSLFVENGWMVLLTMVPIVVGIAALGVRPSGARLLALTWCIVGVVLMVGPHPITDPSPYGRFLLDLYDRSDLAFAFRSTHKAGVILAMGTALLAGWALADFAERGARRIPRFPAAPAFLVTGLVIALAAPFWSTPLYDPVQENLDIPSYWDEAAEWLDAADTGRVLVLPGTTNNGYRWGSVGDDLLDPRVPSRVVASTLPLSTPFAADIVEAIDEHLGSGSYEAGTLRPLAERLGITHVLIRNDVAWEVQGVARPSAFDTLREDPDLEQVAAFGVPGLFVTNILDPQPEEASLAPIEIYRIATEAAPTPTVISDSPAGRQILTDGAGAAMVDLARLGLLDDGHPLRFASTISAESLRNEADDLSLIVLSDSEVATDRRINFYDYEFSATDDPPTSSSWLPGVEADALAFDAVVDASVGSSIGPWLLGRSRRAEAAIDGDPATEWLIPRLVEQKPQTWFIEFDRPSRVGTIEISLLDEQRRIQNLTILADGQAIPGSRNGSVLTAEIPGRVRRIELTVDDPVPGLAPIGIAEIRFGETNVVVSRSLPSRLPTLASDRRLADALARVPLAVVLGQREPTTAAIHREFDLWRTDDFSLRVLIDPSGLPTGCTDRVLAIDGAAVPITFESRGDHEAAIVPCAGQPTIALGPGHHELSFDLDLDQPVGLIALETSTAPLPPLAPPMLGPQIGADAGAIILLDSAFDERWRLDGRDALAPIMLNGLTAFELDEASVGLSADFGPEPSLRLAWVITAVALVVSGLLIGLDWVRPGLIPDPAPNAVAPRHQRWTERSAVAGGALAIGFAWVVTGWIGGITTAAIIAFRPLRDRPRLGYAISAGALVLIASVTAWPLLTGTRSLVDASTSDVPTRIVVAALIGLVTISAWRLDSGSPRSRSSTTRPHADPARS